jgi:hypothetical protein
LPSYIIHGAKLVREPGAGSEEWGKESGKQGCRKKSKKNKNPPKIKKFTDLFFNNYNFSENLDLLPWIQESLQS